MRLLAGVSRTTLDCFHRDVYRPRLALLLLVLLSIVAQQDYAQSAAASSLSAATTHGATVAHTSQWFRLFDRPADAQRLLDARWRYTDAVFARLPKRLRVDRVSRSADTNAQQQLSSNIKVVSAKEPHKVSRSKTTRNVLKDLLNADALSVLVTLHMLWIIRFSAMLLDDKLDKEPFSDTATRIVPPSTALVMLWLVVSSGLAYLSVTYAWADTLMRWGVARRADPLAVSWSIACIKYLELSATLASFASPLCRLCASQSAPYARRKVSLPSPSHSPALIDLLPIPTTLANILSGRDVPATTRPSTSTRRRMAAHWAAPSLHGRRTIATPMPAPPAAPITAETTAVQRRGAPPAPTALTRPAVGLAEPLRLPTTGKAPRVQGMRVNVDAPWLVENSVVLYGHFVGAMQYALILLTLPSFAPTSFPSLLSAISARSEMCAVAATWSAARRSVECLEFVRRRWCTPGSTKPTTTVEYTTVCSICYETVNDGDGDSDEDCCLLDCGHRLHAVCLVQWLTKQSFCPTCHATLKATPPHLSVSSSAAATPAAAPAAEP